jgi:heme oxygenase
VPNLSAPDLALLVRQETAEVHRGAETRPFIHALMTGELTLGDYVRYLAQFAYVYSALESRMPRPADPAILDPALARFAAIESDLAALGVADWRAEHPALPATAAYAAHIRGIGPDDVTAYIAHHYTRYLGDLSGGQAIARLVARHYEATPQQLAFFEFDRIANIVEYKREYRDGLNELELEPEEVERFIAEVRASFAFNTAIFDELAGE